MFLKNRAILGSLVTFLAGCYSATALAQTLETVVVFGARDTTALADSSSLIGYVPEIKLQQAGLEHPSDFFEGVPGIWVSRGSGQEHLTAIRSPVFTGAGACGSFWMAEDGIALRAKGFCNVNQLFDAHFDAAQSLEVYKGPHAALFGSNAQFGGLNINLPGAQDVKSQLSFQGSSLGYRKLHVRGASKGQSAALAGIATAVEDDGWRDQSGFSQQKVTLKYTWQGDVWRSENAISLMHLEQETAGYAGGEDAYKDDDLRNANANPEAFRDADAARIYSRWILEQGANTWTITPYVRTNEMAFLMHFVPWQPLEQNSHDSVGVTAHWQHDFDSGHIFALTEWEQTDGELSEVQYQPAPFGQDRFPEGTHYDFSVKAKSLAAAVGFKTAVDKRFYFDGALRFDSDKYDYETHVQAGFACADGVSGCRFYRPPNQENAFENVSAQLGLNYKLTDELSFFARGANGFRVPQVSELYRAQAEDISGIEEERIKSSELGLRGQWQRVTVQSAFYSMNNKNGIYQDPQRRYVNGVSTQHVGLEYLVQYTPSEHWLVSLNGEFAKHTYENNPVTLGIDQTVNIEGNIVDTAPRQKHVAEVSWLGGEAWRLNAQWVYQGKYYLDPENQWQYPGHNVLNLRGDRTFSNWKIFGSVNNVLNKQYADRADVAFGEPRYFPAAEVSATIGVKYNF